MKRRSSRRQTPANHFWQSYSDLMAGLLLVFMLVLTGSILQIQQKQAELEEAFGTIEEQGAELERILGIRREIVEALKEQFADEELTIDPQTGAIVFNSDLLFAFDDYQLKADGKDFLQSFVPKYMSILLSEEFAPYVAEIIIEGHTDTTSTYLYNLELSQNRALSVARFFLSDEQSMFTPEQLEQIRKIVTANGRSESDPIYRADGTVDMAASRRVEIQFRLKDDEMIAQMLDAIS